MFKNYLTHQVAQNFDRSCRSAQVAEPTKARLIRSSTQMLDAFARSIEAKNPKDEAKLFFVALLNLRDCKEALEQAGVRVFEIESQFQILHKRLEQLCWGHATPGATPRGQMRLSG